MRPMLIGPDEKLAIEALIERAENSPFTIDDLLDMKNGAMAIAGDMGPFTIDIPFGYKVVFSHEQQPAGLVKHLSVSVPVVDKLPSRDSVVALMAEFGYKKPLQDTNIWLEQLEGGYGAVNVAWI